MDKENRAETEGSGCRMLSTKDEIEKKIKDNAEEQRRKILDEIADLVKGVIDDNIKDIVRDTVTDKMNSSISSIEKAVKESIGENIKSLTDDSLADISESITQVSQNEEALNLFLKSKIEELSQHNAEIEDLYRKNEKRQMLINVVSIAGIMILILMHFIF